MPKLKSLRGAVGSYGRVKANGIVDVEDKDVEKLLKTKRFVRATDADVADAEKAQQEFLRFSTAGATPGFMPLAHSASPGAGGGKSAAEGAQEASASAPESKAAPKDKSLK